MNAHKWNDYELFFLRCSLSSHQWHIMLFSYYEFETIEFDHRLDEMEETNGNTTYKDENI